MSFTISTLHGYEIETRYERSLEFVRESGNSRFKSVVFKDENNIEFLWTTNVHTKAYKNLKPKGVYKFTVDHIMNITLNIPAINIRHVTLVKEEAA